MSGNKISMKLIWASMSKTCSAHTQSCAWLWWLADRYRESIVGLQSHGRWIRNGYPLSLLSTKTTNHQMQQLSDSKQTRGGDSSHNVKLNFTSRGFTLDPETSKCHRNFIYSFTQNFSGCFKFLFSATAYFCPGRAVIFDTQPILLHQDPSWRSIVH